MEGIYLRGETIEPSQTRTHHEFFERVKAVSLSMLQILLIELMIFYLPRYYVLSSRLISVEGEVFQDAFISIKTQFYPREGEFR